MPHPSRFDAIVLQTFNVGDADRFCVLFTRERGRIAARAYGVRKPKSRLGAALLPFTHASLELREHGGGWTVESAARVPPLLHDRLALASFARASQGIEILLRLVTHEEPLPMVFDATLLFLLTADDPQALLRYVFSLLALLGLLPDAGTLQAMETLGEPERAFLRCARRDVQLPILAPEPARTLRNLADMLLTAHLTAPLKAGEAVAALTTPPPAPPSPAPPHPPPLARPASRGTLPHGGREVISYCATSSG